MKIAIAGRTPRYREFWRFVVREVLPTLNEREKLWGEETKLTRGEDSRKRAITFSAFDKPL